MTLEGRAKKSSVLTFLDRHAFTDLRIRLTHDAEDGGPAALAWAHRVVLATASPVVRAILTAPGFRESRSDICRGDEPAPPDHVPSSEITLGGISAQTFGSLLDFVYTGRVLVSGAQQALLLFKAADQLDVQDLRVACLDFVEACLRGGTRPSASVELLLLAEALNLEQVSCRCQGFLVAHLELVAAVTPPSVWRLLPHAVMAKIMLGESGDIETERWDAEEAVIVFVAWAAWCGGPWAELADVALLPCVSPRVCYPPGPGLSCGSATLAGGGEGGGAGAWGEDIEFAEDEVWASVENVRVDMLTEAHMRRLPGVVRRRALAWAMAHESAGRSFYGRDFIIHFCSLASEDSDFGVTEARVGMPGGVGRQVDEGDTSGMQCRTTFKLGKEVPLGGSQRSGGGGGLSAADVALPAPQARATGGADTLDVPGTVGVERAGATKVGDRRALAEKLKRRCVSAASVALSPAPQAASEERRGVGGTEGGTTDGAGYVDCVRPDLCAGPDVHGGHSPKRKAGELEVSSTVYCVVTTERQAAGSGVPTGADEAAMLCEGASETLCAVGLMDGSILVFLLRVSGLGDRMKDKGMMEIARFDGLGVSSSSENAIMAMCVYGDSLLAGDDDGNLAILTLPRTKCSRPPGSHLTISHTCTARASFEGGGLGSTETNPVPSDGSGVVRQHKQEHGSILAIEIVAPLHLAVTSHGHPDMGSLSMERGGAGCAATAVICVWSLPALVPLAAVRADSAGFGGVRALTAMQLPEVEGEGERWGVVSGDDDGFVCVWRINMPSAARRSRARISPEATTCLESVPAVPTPQLERTAVLQGHRGSVEAVAYSAELGVLVTAGADASIRLWSTWPLLRRHCQMGSDGRGDTWGCIVCIRAAHLSTINSIALALEARHDGGGGGGGGVRLYSASDDGTVKTWNLCHLLRSARRGGVDDHSNGVLVQGAHPEAAQGAEESEQRTGADDIVGECGVMMNALEDGHGQVLVDSSLLHERHAISTAQVTRMSHRGHANAVRLHILSYDVFLFVLCMPCPCLSCHGRCARA